MATIEITIDDEQIEAISEGEGLAVQLQSALNLPDKYRKRRSDRPTNLELTGDSYRTDAAKQRRLHPDDEPEEQEEQPSDDADE